MIVESLGLSLRRGLDALTLSTLLVAGCPADEGSEDADVDDPPVDAQAILWCVLSGANGQTASGEEVHVLTTSTNRGACLCLPVGTQPYSGSELDALLHDMAVDKCEEDLRALGAVTTTCEELVTTAPRGLRAHL